MPIIDEKKLKYMKTDGIPHSHFGREIPKTGDWRTFKPRIIKGKCIRCRTCVTYCPEGAVSMGKDGYPYINYHVCKGCLVCVKNCPVKAIEALEDLHAEHLRKLNTIPEKKGGKR